MPRNNADFNSGRGSLPLHIAPSSARAGIEAHGLKKSAQRTESPDGRLQPTGVYFWHNERAVYRGLDDSIDEFNGHDVWQLDNPHPYHYIQDASFDSGVALSATSNIHRRDVSRVGHIVNGMVHWHKEEDCPDV